MPASSSSSYRPSSGFYPYTFLSPPYTGLIDVGCPGSFGGLAVRLKRNSRRDVCFFPRDNAAHYFYNGRSYLPVSVYGTGFAFSIRDRPHFHRDYSTFPGVISTDTDDALIRRRNLLLACRRHEDDDDDDQSIDILAVDPDSNRRQIVRRRVTWNGQDRPEATGVLDDILLDTACLQLEVPPFDRSKVLVRTENQLLLVTNDDDKAELFDGLAKTAIFNPNIRSEMAILDGTTDALWWGDVDRPMTKRQLYADTVQDVAWSDHPRLLYVADKTRLYTTDLRTASHRPTRHLFNLPEYDPNFEMLNGNNMTTFKKRQISEQNPLFSKAYIRSVTVMADSVRHLLVATDRQLFLLDERMPNIPLLFTGHSLLYGPDVVLCDTFLEHKKGRVLPIVVLNQEAPNDSLLWPLLNYVDYPSQFSTISPMCRLPAPGQAFRHSLYHAADSPVTFATLERADQAVRGVRLVKHVGGKVGESSALLLRLSTGGDLWYDVLKLGGEVEYEMGEDAVQSMAVMFNDEHEQPSDLPNLDVYDANACLERMEKTATSLEETAITRHKRKYLMKNRPTKMPPEFDPDSLSEDQLLSRFIVESWK